MSEITQSATNNNIIGEMQATLSALQATVEQQQQEIADLRAEKVSVVATIQPTSRRRMLKHVMLAAAGTAAATTGLLTTNGQAQAGGGSNTLIGWYAFPGSGTATGLPGNFVGLAGSSSTDFGSFNQFPVGIYGVHNSTSNGAAILAKAPVEGTAVLAIANKGKGIVGTSVLDNGVYGSSETTHAVRGEINSVNTHSAVAGNASHKDSRSIQGVNVEGTGVLGTSTGGKGVVGESQTNHGVDGRSQQAAGVNGISTEGAGVIGKSSNSDGVRASSGNANGLTSTGGRYGAYLVGKLAPLFLQPAFTQGAPTTGEHRQGEFFVDKDGKLFFCVANGTPGTWKLLAQP
jgi:hypothetical protein